MSNIESLDEFCQVLIIALQSMKKANELPPYMTSKARDINAGFIKKDLNEKIEDGSVLMSFTEAADRAKICGLENLKNKEAILNFVQEYRPYLNRVKSGAYKLILDRFMAAHELAIQLSKIVDEISAHEIEKVEEFSLVDKV